MKKINIIIAICAVIISVTYLQCKKTKQGDPRGDNYAGSRTCIKCHSNIYNSYLHTAHYVASIPATLNTIHGSFAKGSNIFYFSPTQKVIMELLDSGLYQTYYVGEKIKERHRFDIVLGGIKGESYLYWSGNGLNQLPISYFTKEHQWLLSPRFDPRIVNFKRTITSRCMECHASYIGDQPNNPQSFNGPEQFDKSSLIYSVDCERCHGPGAEHVTFQTDNPEVKTARYIVTYNSLPRARKMDMCGNCHSGNKSAMLMPTFKFKPGDTLANFKLPAFETATHSAAVDVHGNQLQLLQSSKCFINSNMDCATCHNVHQNERGNTTLYTQKCINCHSITKHSFFKTTTTANVQFITSNCIQCHMPALPSTAIISATLNKPVSADISVHTHAIAIYPDEAKKILALYSKNNSIKP